MTNQQRMVIVEAFPDGSDVRRQRSFPRELAGRMREFRPCIVLDCSQISTLDAQMIYILLCCLEEALKRNGDIRLAGMPAEARQTLETSGADRIFQIFATNADAVRSFLPLRTCPGLPQEALDADDQFSQDAA